MCRPLLGHCHLQSRLRRADAAEIAARTRAYDYGVALGHEGCRSRSGGGRKAGTVSIRQFPDHLGLYSNTRGVGTKIDLVPELIKIPTEGVATFRHRDAAKIRFALECREHRTISDHRGHIVLAAQAILESNEQNGISHDVDALDSIVHSMMPHPTCFHTLPTRRVPSHQATGIDATKKALHRLHIQMSPLFPKASWITAKPSNGKIAKRVPTRSSKPEMIMRERGIRATKIRILPDGDVIASS